MAPSEMPSTDSDLRIVQAGHERIDDVELLWKALHAHHVAVAPELGESRTPQESWRRRRAHYERWLAEAGAFLLIAETSREPIGYAVVRLIAGSETWQTADQVAEIESLCVLPEHRGQAIGTALLAAIDRRLRDAGVAEVSLAVVATNVEAIRFYERHGLRPRTIDVWRSVE